MAGDTVKSLVTVVLAMACLVLANAGPVFSSSLGAEGSLVVAAGPVKHVIRDGETLNLLAKRYGVPAAAILKANPGINPKQLSLGKEIIIPLGAKPAPAPLAATPEASSDRAAPAGIELRPEKAPQATKPLTTGPAGHDLADVPAPQPSSPAAPQPTASPATKVEQRGRMIAPSTAVQAAPPASIETTKPQPSAAPPAAAPAFGIMPLPAGLWVPIGLAVLVLVVLAIVFHGFCANVLAGLALRALRFFRPGDIIQVIGYEGQVVSRGGLYVTLRTADNARVFVPNVRLLREVVEVLPPPTMMPRR